MEHFEKLYIADIDEVSKKVEDTFLLCGSKNWDYYFTKIDKEIDFEELNNIKLIEFSSKKEFDDFLLINEVLDYSIEQNNLKVLCYG